MELLSSTRIVDPYYTTLITLYLDQSTYRIPSKFVFHIKVTTHDKNIFRTIDDEGALTCDMSFKCWKVLGSPTLVQSHTMQNEFDGNCFSPHGLIVACPLNGVVK